MTVNVASQPIEDLLAVGREALLTADPQQKAKLSLPRTAFEISGQTMQSPGWPDGPAIPERPVLVSPQEVPKRSVHTPKGQVALFHALAHIELNAINLAWDMAGRFSAAPELAERRSAFVLDWAKVAGDEARHFLLLSSHLKSLAADYGDLPAHGGLWDAAQSTSHDLAARLAIVPLVHEARGLDVTPGLIASLDKVGDQEGARVLRIIYEDEIDHVRIGMFWFRFVCEKRGVETDAMFKLLVSQHHRGALKGPFNREARRKAGLEISLYDPLTH